MADKGDTPRDVESEYPWGKKTATYRAWLILFAINVIMLGILFTVFIELPALEGENVFAGLAFDEKAHAQVTEGGTELEVPQQEVQKGELTDAQKLMIYCIAIIAANTIIVWITKTVGKWVSELEEQCKRKKCNWWCLCCNKWHCVLVWVVKWVTYIVTVAMTVITTALVWLCFGGNNPLG